MLIRMGGGRKGIREYLETGRKQGRKESREDLDERIVLAGDLALVEQIIATMKGRGDRYLHITMSFKEDDVDRSILDAVVRDFERFAFTAFDMDEYAYYAEAHLPRIKMTVDRSNQTMVTRKPHIHIVIPKVNLLTDGHLNPFGVVDRTVAFIDAFQEDINAKYGLSSPKLNRRVVPMGKAEVLGRSKGDHFVGANRDLKQEIAQRMLDSGVQDWVTFQALAAEYGDVTIRNAGTKREYLNVKPYEASKGINLKESIFRREFVELSTMEKNRRSSDQNAAQDDQDAQAKVNPFTPSHRADLEAWFAFRAREMKYLNSGNKKRWAAYQDAEVTGKMAMIDELEQAFYQKHAARRTAVWQEPNSQSGEKTERDTVLPKELIQTGLIPLPNANAPKPVNPIDQAINEIAEKDRRDKAQKSQIFTTIKQCLPPELLLAELSASHGIEPEDYPITQGADGFPRIQCGKRQLSICDFLTKEMHLSWEVASGILRSLWNRYSKEERLEKAADITIQFPGGANQEFEYPTGNLGSVRMGIDENSPRVKPDHPYQALLDVIWRDLNPTERERRIKKALLDMAAAITRLEKTDSGTENLRAGGEAYTFMGGGGESVLLGYAKALKHVIGDSGEVIWQLHGQAQFKDAHSIINVFDTDERTVDLVFLLAIQKFGTRLKVAGPEAFKESMVWAAVKSGVEVHFSDVVMQERLEHLQDVYYPGMGKINARGPSNRAIVPKNGTDR